MHSSCFKYFTLTNLAAAVYTTELLSLAKSNKYRNELPYELWPVLWCTSVTLLILFRTWQLTLYCWYQMNLEWVFELGVQRLETLEEEDWHSPVSSGHSNHPGALMHYLGLLEFLVRITHHNTHETYLIYPMIAISENTWSFDYFWHRRIIEPSLTAFIGFPFALVFTFTECAGEVVSLRYSPDSRVLPTSRVFRSGYIKWKAFYIS